MSTELSRSSAGDSDGSGLGLVAEAGHWRERRMAALAEMELSTGASLDEVLLRIAKVATDLLPTSAGASVLLWDPASDDFSVAATTVSGQDADTALTRLGRRGGASRWIVENNEPLYVSDVDTDGFDTNPLAGEARIRSYAGVPIRTAGTPQGVLYALDTLNREYSDEDKDFLDLLARRAGSAITTARLLADARASRERSEALAWVANALIAADELPEVLQAVVEGVLAALLARRVRLVIFDARHRRVLDVVQGDAAALDAEVPPHRDLRHGLNGWVLRNERLALVTGYERDERESEVERRGRVEEGIGAVIVVPLRYGKQVLGTMTVMRDDARQGFSDPEVDLIIAMAGQAAVAIENVRLIESTRSSLRETESLYAVSQSLTTVAGIGDVLKITAEGAVKLMPAIRAEVAVVDVDERRIVDRHDTGSGGEATPEDFDSLWIDARGQALREGVPVEIQGDDATGATLVAPLFVHERRFGTITVWNEAGGLDFTPRQRDLLMTLGAHAAAAIESARLFAEVQRLAVTDDLTQVHNRRYLFELADYEFRQAKRYGRPLSAIMFDIDRFKDINDSYGHAVGDQVLAWFAAKCASTLRDVDVLGRYGGEEFAVLLPETDLKGAVLIAERLRELIASAPLETSQGPVRVTVSAGVSEIHRDMADVHALIDRADAAMYFAKRTGRNRVEGG